MTNDIDDPFLTIPEAAQVLRIHRRTLDNLRWKNEGPKYRRHGGRIVYLLSELLEWSEQRRARTAKSDKTPDPQPLPDGVVRDRLRRSRLPQGKRAAPRVECEPQRPDRPLSAHLPASPDGGASDHPPA